MNLVYSHNYVYKLHDYARATRLISNTQSTSFPYPVHKSRKHEECIANTITIRSSQMSEPMVRGLWYSDQIKTPLWKISELEFQYYNHYRMNSSTNSEIMLRTLGQRSIIFYDNVHMGNVVKRANGPIIEFPLVMPNILLELYNTVVQTRGQTIG